MPDLQFELSNPQLLVSDQMLQRAQGEGVDMHLDTTGLQAAVDLAPGSAKPQIGAVILGRRGERLSSDRALHVVSSGDLAVGTTVAVSDVLGAAREQGVDPLRVRVSQSRPLSEEELRRQIYLAVDRWHAGRGAFDESLFAGMFMGFGLVLAGDILTGKIIDLARETVEGRLLEYGTAGFTGAALGATVLTPLIRKIRYEYSREALGDRYPIALISAEEA